MGNCTSGIAYVTSGVVQGSCIGPLLFLLFINDLSHILSKHATCKMFADDLKLYTVVDADSDTPHITLQNSLNLISEWAKTWQMKTSIDKCSFMTISNKSQPTPAYYIENIQLPQLNITKDLGISIDNKLNFAHHVDKITAKARQRAGLIFKCFTSRDTKTLTKAFTTYIRPLVEYASQVWNPAGAGLIDKLESVQRQYTKRIPACSHLQYTERLKFLNLETLELRRLKSDLNFAYKIIFHKIDLDKQSFFIMRDRPARGHPFMLTPEQYRNNARGNFFSLRITNIWNSLNPLLTNFSTAFSFKKSLSFTNFNSFLRLKLL